MIRSYLKSIFMRATEHVQDNLIRFDKNSTKTEYIFQIVYHLYAIP